MSRICSENGKFIDSSSPSFARRIPSFSSMDWKLMAFRVVVRAVCERRDAGIPFALIRMERAIDFGMQVNPGFPSSKNEAGSRTSPENNLLAAGEKQFFFFIPLNLSKFWGVAFKNLRCAWIIWEKTHPDLRLALSKKNEARLE